MAYFPINLHMEGTCFLTVAGYRAHVEVVGDVGGIVKRLNGMRATRFAAFAVPDGDMRYISTDHIVEVVA